MHAHETRKAPVVVKGHSYHLSASTNADGSLNVAELKDGTAYWIGQYREGNYSLRLFIEHKIGDDTEALIIVRKIGGEPSNYDLDQVEALAAQWFSEIDAGGYKLSGEEHAIDGVSDLIVFVRQKV